MTDWPTVAMVMFTYEPGGKQPRATAERTLRAFLDHVRYSGPLNVHIADDGSDASHRETLHEIAAGYESVGTVGVTNSQRSGYGGSYNIATQAVHTGAEIVVPLEDDWLLMRDLDLDRLVETLAMPQVNCMRLGYLGWTQDLRGTLMQSPAGALLLLDPDSPEPHVFAGHARIETREFERMVGPWNPGLPAGQTEFVVGSRWEARQGIAWPLDLGIPASAGPRSLFTHIGSRDLGELQP